MTPEPACCRAARLRRRADRVWDAHPALADRLEALAAQLLLDRGYPTSRNHDPLTCQERTDR